MAGGGQLARMSQQAAIALGIRLRVLTGSATDSASLAVAETVLGDERSWPDLAAFSADCDVLTFDHEHVPGEYLSRLVADGVAVRPGPTALRHAQDKAVMRARLDAAGVPCPRHRVVESPEQVAAFAAELGQPRVVLKTARGGYDGKGVWITGAEEAGDSSAFEAGVEVLAEELVDFDCEVAAVVARRPGGQSVAYPVVESVQRDGICVEVLAPAPSVPPAAARQAQQIATQIADLLDVVGILAVEMFYTRDGRFLVNELAMRPHNTGHWTIEGAVTSQFENHLRAVLDYPLGAVDAVAGSVVMVNLLGGSRSDLHEALPSVLEKNPDLHVHLYGKAVRPGRKLGHVTLVGNGEQPVARLAERARAAVAELRGEVDG